MNSLKASEIKEIQILAKGKQGEFNKSNDIIGEYIFNILEYTCKTIYYPLQDPELWGFFEKIADKKFVCINTSLPYEKQVFVAAHELYHLWFNKADGIPYGTCFQSDPRDGDLLQEKKANRFAAELLIPEMRLRNEIKLLQINVSKITIKEALKLSSTFFVPYKAMVQRLHEIKVSGGSSYQKLISIQTDEVLHWRKRLGLELHDREQKILLSNLLDLSLQAYERSLITRAKLESLLAFAQVKPSDFGIPEEEEDTPLTDEQIEALLDEED